MYTTKNRKASKRGVRCYTSPAKRLVSLDKVMSTLNPERNKGITIKQKG